MKTKTTIITTTTTTTTKTAAAVLITMEHLYHNGKFKTCKKTRGVKACIQIVLTYLYLELKFTINIVLNIIRYVCNNYIFQRFLRKGKHYNLEKTIYYTIFSHVIDYNVMFVISLPLV